MGVAMVSGSTSVCSAVRTEPCLAVPLISTAMLLALPPPSPEVYKFSEVLEAFKTGKPVDSFGVHGRVDLMEGLPRAKRGTRDYLNALTYSVQSPPIVVNDLVISPAAISSLIKTKEQIPGFRVRIEK